MNLAIPSYMHMIEERMKSPDAYEHGQNMLPAHSMLSEQELSFLCPREKLQVRSWHIQASHLQTLCDQFVADVSGVTIWFFAVRHAATGAPYLKRRR